MIQHLPPQLRSGGCVYTILAAPPSGLEPCTVEEPWAMQQACWEACIEVLFLSCSLEVEEWNSWMACGQLPRWWRSWEKSKQPSCRVFSTGFLSPRGAGLRLGCCTLRTGKPMCTGGAGPHPAPRCGAQPHAPRAGDCNWKETCRENYWSCRLTCRARGERQRK